MSADRVVRASTALASGETAPTGVRRIEAASSTAVRGKSAVGVAVIDTGIDLNHSDLNAVDGKNCVSTSASAQDDEGHGTHVAGTIAAHNNGSGVVGVAPATKLYAVKVLNQNGSGAWSQVICGIDWVTQNAASKGIRVANMSLGGGGSPVRSCASTTDAMHKAICASTAAGVAYAVAAGNSGWDYDYEPQPDVPAAYPQVLTVTALSDTDGSPGGLGSSCGKGRFAERDDRHASFSNYARLSSSQSHTLAAPGVCILSSRLGGGTTSMSGTSMAAPHVAGAMALCIGEGSTANGPCAGLPANGPSKLIAKIIRTDAPYGFYGDPNQSISGRYYGFLSWVGLGAGDADPPDGGGGEGGTPPDGLSLSASGYKVKGVQHADLSWSGVADGKSVDVYRGTTKVATTSNTVYTDNIGARGGGSYTYKVCEAGTQSCSNEVVVAF